MAASDPELLAVVAAGGDGAAEAWRALVARHTPRMWAVARSFQLDDATAADLVQTAWLRLVERADQLRDAGSLGPWLTTIVRNEARRLVTRRRSVPTDDAFDAIADERIDDHDRALVTGERHHAVRGAFARLSESCQQLLRLCSADPPLAYAEIAAAVDRPIGSIGPTRQRCLDQLRKLLPAGVEL